MTSLLKSQSITISKFIAQQVFRADGLSELRKISAIVVFPKEYEEYIELYPGLYICVIQKNDKHEAEWKSITEPQNLRRLLTSAF